MLKEVLNCLNGGDGIVNITLQKKGDEITMSVMPKDKPELSICLNGSVEEVEKDMISISPKYSREY